MSQGVEVAFVHHKVPIVKIIAEKIFKIDGVRFQIGKADCSFLIIVMVLIKGEANKNVIKKRKVIGVHMLPERRFFQSCF